MINTFCEINLVHAVDEEDGEDGGGRAEGLAEIEQGASRVLPPHLVTRKLHKMACLRVQGSGSRVQGSGFRVQGPGSRVQDSVFSVQCSEFRVQGAGCRVQCSVFSVQGLGFRVQGSGFRVLCETLSSFLLLSSLELSDTKVYEP